MESLVHTAFDCGGEVVPHYSTYGRGLPEIDFECEKCGQHLGSIPDVNIVVQLVPESTMEFEGELDANSSH